MQPGQPLKTFEHLPHRFVDLVGAGVVGSRDHEGGEWHIPDHLPLLIHPSRADPQTVELQNPEEFEKHEFR